MIRIVVAVLAGTAVSAAVSTVLLAVILGDPNALPGLVWFLPAWLAGVVVCGLPLLALMRQMRMMEERHFVGAGLIVPTVLVGLFILPMLNHQGDLLLAFCAGLAVSGGSGSWVAWRIAFAGRSGAGGKDAGKGVDVP